MAIVQEKLMISEAAEQLIKSGQGYRDGGVVRNNDGTIFEILKDALNSKKDEKVMIENPTQQVPNVSLSVGKKIAIGTLIVGATAAAGYGIYKLVGFVKKKKEKKQCKEEIIGYNSEVTEYLNGMYQGTLNLKTIKSIIAFFELYGLSDDTNIQISIEEFNVIINITKRYLANICKLNKISIDSKFLIDKQVSTKEEALDEMMCLLKIEKDIFEKE